MGVFASSSRMTVWGSIRPSYAAKRDWVWPACGSGFECYRQNCWCTRNRDEGRASRSASPWSEPMPRQPGESRRWRSAVWFPNDGTSRFLSSCSRQVWVSSSREMAVRRMSLEFTRKRTKLTKTSVSLDRSPSRNVGREEVHRLHVQSSIDCMRSCKRPTRTWKSVTTTTSRISHSV